jgi:hypothetical protein
VRLAEERTADFGDEVSRPQTHDIGFKTLTTYGNGYRLTNNAAFVPKILAGATRWRRASCPSTGSRSRGATPWAAEISA